MINYKFDKDEFYTKFRVIDIIKASSDSIRLIHRHNDRFCLFPFKATGKKSAPILTDLQELVSAFFRLSLPIKKKSIEFDELMLKILVDIDTDIEKEDEEFLNKLIFSLFFADNSFIASNLGLYPYQINKNNKSIDELAMFLYSVFKIDNEVSEAMNDARNNYQFNVLEQMVMDAISKVENIDEGNNKSYFILRSDIQQMFREDFLYMLNSNMTSIEDFSNLFSIYYFYYISQSCILLDHFCHASRENLIKFYYALDWEKVSKNRKCCVEGWEKLKSSINHIFSHAITLELLNQIESKEMVDYIKINEFASVSKNDDVNIANEIKKIEFEYCNCIGDYKKFDSIVEKDSKSETEKGIIHLFECVEAQFLNTDRKRARQFYSEKFSEFCKSRWLKNRKKSGYVLNLTERDIIFLTKISIKKDKRLKLNHLFIEYEKRGIYLDNNSREYLQDFFTKLNLIDKKSDSGDAQYVKQIL